MEERKRKETALQMPPGHARLKLGIIGTNYISDNLCKAAEQIPEVDVCAVYSRKQETGEIFAGKYGIGNVYTDYKKFLESELDAVYVASPNYMHCEQALAAMNHGKHVLCEKVMAVNEREIRSMIDCARKNQVILLEAMRPDFDPALDLVEQHLPELGKLRRVTFEYCQYSGRYDRFREGEVLNAFNPRLSNAAIMDIGVYCIHSLVRLFGMPKGVKAFSAKLENGFEGSGIVLMQYDGMIAEAVYSKNTVSVNSSVLQGEDGSLLIDYIGKPEKMEVRLRKGCRDGLAGGVIKEIPYETAENNMVFEVREFARLIEAKEVEHKYLKYSLDTIRVIDEARRQNGIVFQADSVL